MSSPLFPTRKLTAKLLPLSVTYFGATPLVSLPKLLNFKNISPVQIPTLQAVNKNLSCGKVCSHRNVNLHIAKSKEVKVVRLMALD